MEHVYLFAKLDVLKDLLVLRLVNLEVFLLVLFVPFEQKHKGKVATGLVYFVLMFSARSCVRPHWMNHSWLIV